MSSTAVTDRRQAIDRYVRLWALEEFFYRLMRPVARETPTLTNLFPRDVLALGADFGTPAEIHHEMNALLTELWPDEEDLEGEEYGGALHEAAALTAQMFALAAARSDVFAAEAADLIGALSPRGEPAPGS